MTWGVAPDRRATSLCSLDPTIGVQDTSLTHFVGSALADTLPAGLGGVKPSREGGHWGPGRQRAVYGQLVRLDTLGGASADQVREALRRQGLRDVLVVPWDYDPGCEPTYWNGSAQWVEEGLVGFYKLKLRPQKQWHDGRPSFDAFAADLQPYPHGPFFREGYKGTDALRRRASLDAREMFQLYQVLPIWTKAKLDTQALQPMERWARENPGLAGKYPADEILADLRRFIRRPG